MVSAKWCSQHWNKAVNMAGKNTCDSGLGKPDSSVDSVLSKGQLQHD